MRKKFGLFALIPLVALCVVLYLFLDGWIEAGLNQDVAEGEEVSVNWITVKYALTHTAGFKEVSKNTFVYDGNVKTTKKARK